MSQAQSSQPSQDSVLAPAESDEVANVFGAVVMIFFPLAALLCLFWFGYDWYAWRVPNFWIGLLFLILASIAGGLVYSVTIGAKQMAASVMEQRIAGLDTAIAKQRAEAEQEQLHLRKELDAITTADLPGRTQRLETEILELRDQLRRLRAPPAG